MQILKNFSTLLLFLPIANVHSNYEYIEINAHNEYRHRILKLKNGVFFDDRDIEKNKTIISEIFIGLENTNLIIESINLSNKNIGQDVIKLLINRLEKEIKTGLLAVELDLSYNKIDYNALKYFFQILSSTKLFRKFELEIINLSYNNISSFFEEHDSIEILSNFIKSQEYLRILDLCGNDNQIAAKIFFNLFEKIKFFEKFRLIELKLSKVKIEETSWKL